MGNKKLAKILEKKSIGGAVIILSGTSDPIHFKSLLFDPQYRFNPYCEYLWAWKESHPKLWKKFLENDEKAYFTIGIDTSIYPQIFDPLFMEEDEKEVIDSFFKVWANRLAEVIATFYPASARLVTPYAEIETSNAENPKLNPEVLIKVIIQNFTAKDYHTLFDKLKEVLKPFNPKVRKLPEPKLYFDDLKGLIKGTGKFEETEWDHCYHIAEKLAEVEKLEETSDNGKPKTLKEIRERFWFNPFRVWWEEAHLGRTLPDYYKVSSVDDIIDVDELPPKPVVNCPKCGKLIEVNPHLICYRLRNFEDKVERATLSELRKHLVGFKPEGTMSLPCGHSKIVDATTVKEVIWNKKTYCPHCKKWISIPENWKLPPKLAKLKQEIHFKSLTTIPENIKKEVYRAECGCYLTPEEWNKLVEQTKRLTCPKCLNSYPPNEISFKDGQILFPCGHTASYKEVISINDEDLLNTRIKESLDIFKHWDIFAIEAILSKGPDTIRKHFNNLLNSFEAILFAKKLVIDNFGDVYNNRELWDKYLPQLLELPFDYKFIENVELFLASIVKYHADALPDIAPKAKELLFKLNPNFDLDKVINHALDKESLELQNEFLFGDDDF